MGSRAVGVLLAAVLWGCPASGASQDVFPSPGSGETAGPPQERAAGVPFLERVRIGVQGWFSQGSGQWEIGFAGTDPVLGGYSGRSRLQWEGIDATLGVLTAEVRVAPWLSVGGAYGSGEIRGGRSTDSDWLDVPSRGVLDFQVSESIADSDGRATLYDVNAYVRLTSLPKQRRVRGHLDVFLGYQFYEDALRLRNGVQTVIN